MRTIYITAGHSTKAGQDNGAVTEYGNEAHEARTFVTSLARDLYKKGIMTYTDNDDWTLSQTINWLGTRVKKPSYTIDIHFNAFYKAAASGVEIIIPELYNKEEFYLADKIASKIEEITKITRRRGKLGVGVKTETESQHSRLGILSSNKLSSANNLLIELCFISNPDDMKKYRDNYDALIKGISEIINEVVK